VPEVTVIPENAQYEVPAYQIAATLRRGGVATDIAFRGNAKKRFEAANRKGVVTKLTVRGYGPDEHVIRLSTAESEDESENLLNDRIFRALGQRYEISRLKRTGDMSPDAILRPR
jgi:histidyl-tRNA synthetase